MNTCKSCGQELEPTELECLLDSLDQAVEDARETVKELQAAYPKSRLTMQAMEDVETAIAALELPVRLFFNLLHYKGSAQ